MIDKDTICEKVKDIFPDIGVCGIDLDAEFDQEQNRWTIWLKKDHHRLKTYLDPGDAELCLTKNNCIGLSIEVAQLEGNMVQTL